MSRCARQARKASRSWARPRSGRAGARRSKLPPGPGSGCGRGAGRPSRTDARDGPVDSPGHGSGCRSRPRLRPRAGSASCFGGRPTRSRARARPGCPAAQRTDPEWPAGGSAGAARRPGRPRPSSPSRTRAAPRALPRSAAMQRRPRASLPAHRPEQVSSQERMRSHWVSVSGAILGQTRQGQDSQEDNRWRVGCPIYTNTT